MNTNYMGFCIAPSSLKTASIRINQDRMQTALTAEVLSVPTGLDREQLRKFIIDSGKK